MRQGHEQDRSDEFAAIHETMEALHEVGAVGKKTMRELDSACLTPVQTICPEEIRSLWLREHISTCSAHPQQLIQNQTNRANRDGAVGHVERRKVPTGVMKV